MTDDESTRITLAEWAHSIGREEVSIQKHWRTQPGFPQPVGRRREPGRRGPGTPEFDAAELAAWRVQWEEQRERPAPKEYDVPGDPDERRTLGAIARLLGVDGKTVTQYRDLLDERAAHEDRGARRLYRTGDVVAFLNSRGGAGVALDPSADARRTKSRPKGN
ncbi:hypothetical protein [Nonomuraea sp. WAC 01424]|uniref:hypothetical protein n=1 Tax=Nonomuraea sp. WAC 01424 TaxID=2203200 RepID=UPI000F788F8F|nr:hypothetical protein [Nonomuraea sp. WAC 01424]